MWSAAVFRLRVDRGTRLERDVEGQGNGAIVRETLRQRLQGSGLVREKRVQ